MAQKKKFPAAPEGALVTMAKGIGATMGTVAGALGITPDKPAVKKATKPVKKAVARNATPKNAIKKAIKKAAKASKPAAKKSPMAK
jgi:L-serine deaminase